jgi:hypothetical protein
LSSCETIKEIRQSDVFNKAGQFRLNPVHPNTYWFNGKTYEYNDYKIEIVSWPCKVHVKWDGKYIGDTPMIYSFTGTLDKDDVVRMVVIPFDESFGPQEAVLRIRDELPRKMDFKLNKK